MFTPKLLYILFIVIEINFGYHIVQDTLIGGGGGGRAMSGWIIWPRKNIWSCFLHSDSTVDEFLLIDCSGT